MCTEGLQAELGSREALIVQLEHQLTALDEILQQRSKELAVLADNTIDIPQGRMEVEGLEKRLALKAGILSLAPFPHP